MSQSTRLALLLLVTFKISFLIFVVNPAIRRHAEFRAAVQRWEDAEKRGDIAGMQQARKDELALARCATNRELKCP